MADEIASVGIKFDTTDVERGNASLDVLASKGEKVEQSLAKVEQSGARAGKSIASIGVGGIKDIGDSSARAAAGVDQVGRSLANAAQQAGKTALSWKEFVGQNMGALMRQFSAEGLSHAEAHTRAIRQIAEEWKQYKATGEGANRAVAAASGQAASAIAGNAAAIKAQAVATAGLGDSAGGMARGLSLATAAGGAFIGAFSVAALAGIGRSFLSVADSITQVRTQLRLVEGSTAGATSAYEQLLSVAQRSRVSFTDLATTYAQIRRATEGIGISARDTMRVTETLAKAITIGGGSAQSTQAALVQLSQGLASGTLRGEELNSILEQTPRVARALADGLGVSIGQLRKMGEEGQLTGERVAEAFLKSSEAIDREFGQAATTVGQAITVLGNSVANLVGVLDQQSGASGRAAGGLVSLSRAVDAYADAVRRNREFFTLNPATEFARQQIGTIGGAAFDAVRRATSQKFRDEELARELAPNEAIMERRQREAKEALDAAKRMQEAVDRFASASSNMTKAEQKLAAQNKLLTDFATAVRGFANDSEQYLKARRALDVGLANLNREPKQASAAVDRRADQEALRQARELAAAQAQASGFTADYTEKLQQYQEWRAKLNITEEQYVELVEQLIGRQPAAQQISRDHTSALKAEEIALAAIAKARAQASDAEDRAMRDTETLIGKLRDEADAYGMSAEALSERALQRALDSDAAKIAQLESQDVIGLTAEEIARIDEHIDALKRLSAQRISTANAADDKRVRDANARAAEDAAREWERTAGQIEQSLANALMDGGRSGLDYIKGIFRTAVLQPVLRPVANAITGAVTGAMGAPAAASSLGTAASGASLLSSLGAFSSSFGAGLQATFGGLGLGTSLSAAGSAIGSGNVAAGLGLGAGALAPYVAVAAAIVTLLQDKGGPKEGGSAVSTVAGSVITPAERDQFLYTPTQFDADLARTTGDLARTVQTMAQRFGGDASAVRFGLGFDTDPQGDAPNRISAFAGAFSDTNRDVGRDPQQLQAGIAEEVIRLTLAGLQASNLSGGFAAFFARLDPATAAPDAIANLIALGESLRTLGEQSKNLPGAMGQIAALSATARESLVSLAGGFDALLSKQATFRQEFLTAEERFQIDRANIADEFLRITGASLSSFTDGKSGEQIRESFKDLVLGIDLTSEHGSAAYAALLALSGPFAQFIKDMESLGEVTPDATAALQAELAALEAEFGDLSTPVETVADKIARLTGEIDSMEQSLANILGTAEKTPLERLADTVSRRDTLIGVRGNIADTIQAQQVQGFRNRGDISGAVDFLKAAEGELWQQLGTAMDDGTTASKIVQTFMERMQLEAEREVNGPNLDSLKAQVSLLEAMQAAAENIRDTLVDLTTGSLSALSPTDQLAASRSAFESTLAAARSGDQDAIANLAGSGRSFLEEAQSFFGSGGDYASIFARVTADLEAFAGTFSESDLEAARNSMERGGIDNTPAVIDGLQAIDSQLARGIDWFTTSRDDQVAAIRDQTNVNQQQLDVLRDEQQRAQIRAEAIVAEMKVFGSKIDGLVKELALEK